MQALGGRVEYRLAGGRKTSPEIAAELFLSQKAVETHLHNIFGKIDVSSRVAPAWAVERADRALVTDQPACRHHG